MFENVVVCGDSLAEGAELLIKNESRYSALVSKNFNAKEYNFAVSGVGNELISSYLISELLNLISTNKIQPKTTLVIISWSFIERTNFYSKYNNSFIVSSYKKLKSDTPHRNNIIEKLSKNKFRIELDDLLTFYHSHNEDLFFMYNTAKHIYTTQCFLEAHNIKYVFLFSTKAIYDQIFNFEYNTNNEENRIQYLNHNIPDIKQYINGINLNNIFDVFISDYCKKYKLPSGINGHPLEPAHKQYSELLIKFIKNKHDFSNN